MSRALATLRALVILGVTLAVGLPLLTLMLSVCLAYVFVRYPHRWRDHLHDLFTPYYLGA